MAQINLLHTFEVEIFFFLSPWLQQSKEVSGILKVKNSKIKCSFIKAFFFNEVCKYYKIKYWKIKLFQTGITNNKVTFNIIIWSKIALSKTSCTNNLNYIFIITEKSIFKENYLSISV